MKNYRDLNIYSDAFEMAIKIQQLSLKMPKYELYELGSQIRRSSQSVRSNIIERYGRKNYKNDFIKFLTYAYASCLETQSHIEMMNILYSLDEDKSYFEKYDNLGKQIFAFIEYVRKIWKTTDNR
ncbi:MAG: four helix bundle protein [Saprospiraceae bacterium]|nr:four helix bundle protein [Saprospiraceae bacterium]